MRAIPYCFNGFLPPDLFTYANYPHKIPLSGDRVLGILNHAYRIENDTIYLPFTFSMVDDTREAFIIPNQGRGISVVSATTWINDVQIEENQLTLRPGSEGTIIVNWNEAYRIPVVTGLDNRFRISLFNESHLIETKVKVSDYIVIKQSDNNN